MPFMRPLALICAAFVPSLAAADGLPPGLASAALRPGWTTPQGHRMTAVDLVLEPGWKTYWRAPGDAGIPPSFDWTGSQNVGAITVHWPAPEVIDSGGVHTLGFHDRLLLPIEIAPADPAKPVSLAVSIDFGLCREICVPAHAALTAAPAGPAPDPQIEAALARVPRRIDARPDCRLSPVSDGMRVEARIPATDLPPTTDGKAPEVAMELTGNPEAGAVWVSAPEVVLQDGGLVMAAEFVPPSAAPFDLDKTALRLTLIGDDEAVETQGCAG